MFSCIRKCCEFRSLIRQACVAAITASTVLGSLALPESWAEAADSGEKVVHVYLIRRELAIEPIESVGVLAHSALLLKTEAGRFFTLEYMDDSNTYLTEGKQNVIKVHKHKKMAEIKMTGRRDGKTKAFEWERQLSGKSLKPEHTPEALRAKMERAMQGRKYSIRDRHHCHAAQERLRRELGVF